MKNRNRLASRLTQRHGGFSLLEVILAVGVSAAIGVVVLRGKIEDSRMELAHIEGQKLKSLGTAANSYVVDNYNTLIGAASTTITVDELKAGNYVNAAFSGAPRWGGGYQIVVERRGTFPNYQLEGKVTTTSPMNLTGEVDYALLGKAVGAIGADGGMAYDNATVSGASGAWSEANSAGQAGVLAMRIGTNSGGMGQFLRADGTRAITRVVVSGDACAPNGTFGRNADGALHMCVAGRMTPSSSISDTAASGAACTVNGAVARSTSTGEMLICNGTTWGAADGERAYLRDGSRTLTGDLPANGHAIRNAGYVSGGYFTNAEGSGYYVAPSGTNRMNYVVADNQYTYGNAQINGVLAVGGAASVGGTLDSQTATYSPIYYDRNNAGYYVQPSGTNRLNAVLADSQYTYGENRAGGMVTGDTFRDNVNWGYYLQPSQNNRLNYVIADNQYTYGSNTNTGMVTGNTFRDNINHGYYLQPSQTSRLGYTLADNSHVYNNSTTNGYTLAYNGQYTYSNGNWSFLGGDGSGSWNVAPRSYVGSAYINDALIRSTNGGPKWLSDIANQAGGITVVGATSLAKFSNHGGTGLANCGGSTYTYIDGSGNIYSYWPFNSYFYLGNVGTATSGYTSPLNWSLTTDGYLISWATTDAGGNQITCVATGYWTY